MQPIFPRNRAELLIMMDEIITNPTKAYTFSFSTPQEAINRRQWLYRQKNFLAKHASPQYKTGIVISIHENTLTIKHGSLRYSNSPFKAKQDPVPIVGREITVDLPVNPPPSFNPGPAPEGFEDSPEYQEFLRIEAERKKAEELSGSPSLPPDTPSPYEDKASEIIRQVWGVPSPGEKEKEE